MVITSFEEKENRKLWVPIRPGNRGGWSLFDWASVRDMPYKAREMYLGNTCAIGMLHQGGKWRKKDWYLQPNKKKSSTGLSEEEEARRRDAQRMRTALNQESDEDAEQLDDTQVKQILKSFKIKKEMAVATAQDEPVNTGLGFVKAKVEIKAKPIPSKENPHRLEGIGVDQEEKRKRSPSPRKKNHREKHRHRDSSEQSKDRKRQRSRSPERKHKSKHSKKEKKRDKYE